MSLVTRMLGFGLCVVGAFVAGYSASLHTTSGVVDGWIINNTGGVAPSTPYTAQILAKTNGFIQQNVTSVWTYYLAIGVALAICGAVIVAAGDRKAKNAESLVARKAQPPR